MRDRTTISRSAGFSLVEVLVALIVICVGLLGIAKMQALALSNTTSARLRSLAAIEAASLASAMHADRGYWTTFLPGSTVSASGGAATSTDGTLQGELTAAAAAGADNYCTQGAAGSVAPCKPVQVAAVDLQTWAADLNGLMPSSQASIQCDPGPPLTCSISLNWVENFVSINKASQTDTNNVSIQKSNYLLYVQP